MTSSSSFPLLSPLLLTFALSLACTGEEKESATEASTLDPSTTDASTTDASTSASSTSASSTSDASTSSSTTAGSTTAESTTVESTTGPDRDYQRECQPGDFICDDWGCESPPVVVGGECYKRCTPSEIGGLDDECDEPQRPYCSQVGRALGGDYDCNGCAHVCLSAPKDQCDEAIDGCSG